MAMYEDNDYRFIVACFAKPDVGRLFNVAGHAMAGLMDRLATSRQHARHLEDLQRPENAGVIVDDIHVGDTFMSGPFAPDRMEDIPELEMLEAAADFLDYRTGDGALHARIARWPVVVIKTDRQNLLRRLYLTAVERHVPANPVVMEMVDENTKKQLANTAAVTVDEAQFICVALFEKNGTLHDLTKKFSLMR